LIVDAFHNLGDVLAIIVSFVAILFAAKAVTQSMTFGYVRAGMMAGFVNSAFLCVTMGLLFFEAIEKLLSPTSVASLYVAATAPQLRLLQMACRHIYCTKMGWTRTSMNTVTSVVPTTKT
jgi:divalent metal cation (Fe/Co/Zn/Cd) transporter